MRTKFCLLLIASLSALLTITSVKSNEQAASSPEERARIVQLSKQYESDILGPNAKAIGTEIVEWWTKVPDLSVDWCANLFTDEHPKAKDLAGAVTIEALAAAGVFVIENKEKASDSRAVWIAGLEGVVRAYRQLVARDAERKDRFLEKLSELQAKGKLGQYVDAHSSSCH